MTQTEWIVVALVAVAVLVAIAILVSRKAPKLPPPEEPRRLPKAPVEPAEAPKAEAPKAEAPKAEAPKVEAPKAEAPKAEARPEAPREEPVAATAPAPEAEAVSAPVTARVLRPAELRKDKAGDLSALKKGLAQTRGGWMQRLLSVFTGRKEIDPALLDEIEETLLTGDVGIPTTKRFVDGLKGRLDRKELQDADKVWDALRADALTILDLGAPTFGASATAKPFVVLMVGVNGAGKTTTIAKLAARYHEDGKRVLLAAGDTFRAAAVAQLEMWGHRVGVAVHKGKEGAKPSGVVYEAVARGVSEGVDVVIADTAGRLQTKAPLMEELRKIRDACGKACPGAPHEVLLVLDATTGQNAISQAREFRETLELTGVVLTKLDGTAKGGVILAIADEFKLPVRFIGVGEKSEDLREFEPHDFVDALFARGEAALEG